MKLRLHLSALLIISSIKLSAQTKAIDFGVHAGIASTSLGRTLGKDFILQEPDGSGLGYFAGLFASFNIGQFSLQPGVDFSSIAGKSTEETQNGDIIDRAYGRWRLNYIKVPVNLIYNIPANGGQFYVGAGAYFSSALSGKFTPSADNYSSNQQTLIAHYTKSAKFGNDNKSDFKKTDYGVCALAGFAFDNGVMINAIYNLGLVDVQSRNYTYGGYLYESAKLSSLGLSLGYKF
jgi:hypothetical protein